MRLNYIPRRTSPPVGDTWTFQVIASYDGYQLWYFHIRGTLGKSISVNWGDSPTYYPFSYNGDMVELVLDHTWATVGTYTVTITGDILDMHWLTLGYADCILTIEDLPQNLVNLSLQMLGSQCTGSISNLPPNLNWFSTYYTNFTGSIDDLPSGLTYLGIGYSTTTYTGDLSNLPAGLVGLDIQEPTHFMTGSIDDLPSGITSLVIGFGEFTGSTDNLNPNLLYLDFFASTLNITGDFANLPRNLTHLRIYGLGNGFTGELGDLPSTLGDANLSGCNNIAGSIEDLPIGMYQIGIANCFGEFTGDLSGIPSSITYLQFQNLTSVSMTGDIQDLPPTIISLSIASVASPFVYDSAWVLMACTQIYLGGAFSTTLVSTILANVLATSLVGYILDLRLGGNDPPDAQGLLDVATLRANGWTVYINE